MSPKHQLLVRFITGKYSKFKKFNFSVLVISKLLKIKFTFKDLTICFPANTFISVTTMTWLIHYKPLLMLIVLWKTKDSVTCTIVIGSMILLRSKLMNGSQDSFQDLLSSTSHIQGLIMHVKSHLCQEEIKEDKEKDGSQEAVILMASLLTLPRLNLFSLLKMQESKTYSHMFN